MRLLLAGTLFLASLVAAVLGFSNTNAPPTPPDLKNLESFVIFGSEDVYLAKSTSFSGTIGSNRTLTIAKESIITGDLIADTLELHKEVTVNGNVSANRLKIQRDEGILGTTATSVSLPVATLLTIPDFETGNADVRASATTTIPAGKYKNITIEKGTFVVFSGGTYALGTLTAFQDAKLLFTATTTFFIKKKLIFHDHVVMAALPSMPLEAIKVFHKGNEPIVIGNRAVLFGTFFAPHTSINAGKEVEMRGRLLAKSVRVDKEGHISIEESFVSEAEPSTFISDPAGGVYVVNELLVSLIPEATRVDAENIAQNLNGRVVGIVSSINLYQIQVPAVGIAELSVLLEAIRSQENPKIEGVTRDYLLPENL